jgi:hypothetical protein
MRSRLIPSTYRFTANSLLRGKALDCHELSRDLSTDLCFVDIDSLFVRLY